MAKAKRVPTNGRHPSHLRTKLGKTARVVLVTSTRRAPVETGPVVLSRTLMPQMPRQRRNQPPGMEPRARSCARSSRREAAATAMPAPRATTNPRLDPPRLKQNPRRKENQRRKAALLDLGQCGLLRLPSPGVLHHSPLPGGWQPSLPPSGRAGKETKRRRQVHAF